MFNCAMKAHGSCVCARVRVWRRSLQWLRWWERRETGGLSYQENLWCVYVYKVTMFLKHTQRQSTVLESTVEHSWWVSGKGTLTHFSFVSFVPNLNHKNASYKMQTKHWGKKRTTPLLRFMSWGQQIHAKFKIQNCVLCILVHLHSIPNILPLIRQGPIQ